jgi:hypothetical protein
MFSRVFSPRWCRQPTHILTRAFGAFGGIRTPNLLIRSQMLYPLSYERLLCCKKPSVPPESDADSMTFAEKEGFEPSDQVSPVNSLAVSPIRPLSHFSVHVPSMANHSGN